jgi:hypothetical protein
MSSRRSVTAKTLDYHLPRWLRLGSFRAFFVFKWRISCGIILAKSIDIMPHNGKIRLCGGDD